MQPDSHAHLAPTAELPEITLADVLAVCPLDEKFPSVTHSVTDPYTTLHWLESHGYNILTPLDEIEETEKYFRAQEEFHEQALYKTPRTEQAWKFAFGMQSSIERYKQQLQLNPEEIKSAHPIVEVAKNYTKLTKRGKEWTGCCPIHHEKTPSFSVSDAKQMWFCFGGCAKGGDVIDLVMAVENMSFKDALKHLSTF
jgi:hypothetical protein